MKTFELDTYITQGTTYKTEDRVALIIGKKGTNSAGAGHLHIGRIDTLDIKEIIAPLHKTSSNVLGLLNLGNYYDVIKPKEEFYWVGDSGSKCRIKGLVLELEPGETLPGEYLDRYEQQDRKGITFLEGTKSLAAGTVWAAGEELTVLQITPTTREKYLLNNVVMCDVVNRTNAEEEINVRLYEGREELTLSIIEPTRFNYDLMSFPRPPRDDVEIVPYSFAKRPLALEPDLPFKVTFQNITTTDWTVPTGVTWILTFTAIIVYEIGS